MVMLSLEEVNALGAMLKCINIEEYRKQNGLNSIEASINVGCVAKVLSDMAKELSSLVGPEG